MKRKRKQNAIRIERISILIFHDWFVSPQGRILDFGEVYLGCYIACNGGDDKAKFAQAVKGNPPIASVAQRGSTTLFGRVKLQRRLETFSVARKVPTDSDDAKRYLDDIRRGKTLIADQYGRTAVEQQQQADWMAQQEYVDISMLLCQADLTYKTVAPTERAKGIDNVHDVDWEHITAMPLSPFQYTFGSFLYNLLEWVKPFRGEEFPMDVDGDSNWLPPESDLVHEMKSSETDEPDLNGLRAITT